MCAIFGWRIVRWSEYDGNSSDRYKPSQALSWPIAPGARGLNVGHWNWHRLGKPTLDSSLLTTGQTIHPPIIPPQPHPSPSPPNDWHRSCKSDALPLTMTYIIIWLIIEVHCLTKIPRPLLYPNPPSPKGKQQQETKALVSQHHTTSPHTNAHTQLYNNIDIQT